MPSEYGNALVMEGTAMADEMELAGLIQGVKHADPAVIAGGAAKKYSTRIRQRLPEERR